MKKELKKLSNGLKMSTKNKIYVLGDSFCYGGHIHNDVEYFWVNDLYSEFKDTHNILNISYPSRDVQTIIDNWIKLLKHLNKDDILIICIPFFIRIRVPLHEKDQIIDSIDDIEIINRFVTHHSWYYNESNKIYSDGDVIEKEELDKHVTFFEGLFYNSISVEKNYNEVIESLYELTNCKKYIFSWDTMKTRSNIIEYRDGLDKKLGWSTMADLYTETNGEHGRRGDFHWDYRFQQKFAHYLIEKFKK